MSKEIKTLKLTFNCADGKVGTLLILEPKEGLDETTIQGAMDNLIASNAIGSKTARFKEKVGAELLTRKTESLYRA